MFIFIISHRLNHRIIDWQPFDYIPMDTVSVGTSIAKPPDCRHCSGAKTKVILVKRILANFLRFGKDREQRNGLSKQTARVKA